MVRLEYKLRFFQHLDYIVKSELQSVFDIIKGHSEEQKMNQKVIAALQKISATNKISGLL